MTAYIGAEAKCADIGLCRRRRLVAVQDLWTRSCFKCRCTFEVVTFRRADVFKHWPADKRFTWYPGYSWTVATCPRCSAHLGWAFQPSEWPDVVTDAIFEESEQTFVALIVDKLLQENFAATLLIPKSFRS
ncbi:hypothetical protein COCON_G00157760 [Conger conger]|uniref:CULT domain-containing protein n=1 Tax=Conger conger TaxID=82655 RepID=A0A9Q1HUG5_CONCO|nr:hypothetical protein COCON_G00157760 [Conger conger]